MQTPDDAWDGVLQGVLDVACERPDDALRSAVLERTLGAMRRRRQWRRGSLAVALPGCYLAGILTAVLGSFDGAGRGALDTARARTEGLEPAGRTSVEESAAGSGDPRRAIEVARQAVKSPNRAIENPHRADFDGPQIPASEPSDYQRWRHAGDSYLNESGDIALAVRNYARALDVASDEERTISPGADDWLLMALKDARAKEKRHAQPQQN